MYRCFAKDFRVFVFSRRNRMLRGFSHGVYEQAKDFNSRVLKYLIRQR